MGGMLNALVGSFAPASGSFESIASVTTTGSQTSVQFSSIPGNYKHLQIRGISRDTALTAAALTLQVRFNGATNQFDNHSVYSDGSGAFVNGTADVSGISLQSMQPGDSAGANIFGASIIDIINYASTTKNKVLKYFAGANNNDNTSANQGVSIGSGEWRNLSAITSVQIVPLGGAVAFKNGSIFSLYGIRG